MLDPPTLSVYDLISSSCAALALVHTLREGERDWQSNDLTMAQGLAFIAESKNQKHITHH